MIKIKNKKIIIEAAAIIVLLILSTNIQATPDQCLSECKKGPRVPFAYLIFGMGYISSMTINGETDIKGKLNGDLYIKNEPGWGAPEDYKLYIYNRIMPKIYTKNTLPEQFILENFVGIGYIKYVNIPHSIDATKYFIIGKAMFILE